MSATKNKRGKQVSAGHQADDAGTQPRAAPPRRYRMDKDKPHALWKGYAWKLVFDANYVAPVCYLILSAELLLNYLIVENVPYTEIDWRAYMQEVEGFLNGTLDYAQLKGDTGPCVYPAGFLYVYAAFYYVTSQGSNVKLAQYIFIAIYLLQTYLTYKLVIKTCKLPGYALALSFLTSYRIHSIYVLRLFNDPIAVLLFYAALNAFAADQWHLGSLLFSLGVSIKMNILLYAPCLLLAYVANLSKVQVLVNLAICALTQLILGLPFLLTHPFSYIKASFDLGRVFEHKWTVNYRFLDVEVFTDRRFHVALLVLHVSLLLLFAPLCWKYFKAYRTLRNALTDMKQQTVARNVERKKRAVPPGKPDDAPLTEDQQKFLDAFEKQIKVDNAKQNAQVQHKPRKAKQQPVRIQQEEPEKYTVNFSKVTQLFVLPFFATNLIGIACARSLHYQFYSWYFHSLLYIAFSTPYQKPLALLLLGLLETSWNIYPSTEWSSATLHVVHFGLLYGLYKTMRG